VFPTGYEPSPPSVVSVASRSSWQCESEPDPDFDEGSTPFHSAAADGGPDLSRHDAGTQAILRAAVTGPIAFGRCVTHNEYMLVLEEFKRLQLPYWMNSYGPNDQVSWKLPSWLNPGHVAWGVPQSDDLGAIVGHGCSCQFKKFSPNQGKQFNVRGPKHRLLAAAEQALRMAWEQALVRVNGGEWVSRRGAPEHTRPAERFSRALQQGGAPSRRQLERERDEAVAAAAAARSAAPPAAGVFGGYPAPSGMYRSYRMVSINQGYV
jgi:hypothetical protein